MGTLELGIHNIAPYKSKGIEKALELSACWNSKANTTDKYLPSDCGTSGKVESTFLHVLIHPCHFTNFEFNASVLLTVSLVENMHLLPTTLNQDYCTLLGLSSIK